MCWLLPSSLACVWRVSPRAGSKTGRVINAVEDGIFLANQIYNKTLLRFGQGNIEFKW